MADTQTPSSHISIQPILVVEDSDADFEAFKRVTNKLSIKNPIYRCSNGDEALDFLYHAGEYTKAETAPRPAVILMDLNLPGTDGRDLIEQLKKDQDLKLIPMIVLTTSANPKDIEICYQYGVNSYMLKPIGTKALMKTIQDFFHYWFEAVVLPHGLYSGS